MPQNRNWKQGTERVSHCHESYSRPDTVKFDLFAKDHNDETIAMKAEISKQDLIEYLSERGQVRVLNVIPFVKLEEATRRDTREFRRAAAG